MAKRNVLRLMAMVAVALTAVVHSNNASALDTLEQFDPGASDLELYLGADGFGRPTEDRSVYGMALAGYGVTNNISAFFGMGLSANGALADGGHEFFLGGYGTIVDTDHFDFDLVLAIAEGGGDFAADVGFQANFDLKPDLALAGIFIDAYASIYGNETGHDWQTDVDIPFIVGAYWTFIPDHQLLVAYNGALTQSFRESSDYDVGNVGLGYNFVVVENFELITDVYVDLPQDAAETGVGFSVGFIATMP